MCHSVRSSEMRALCTVDDVMVHFRRARRPGKWVRILRVAKFSLLLLLAACTTRTPILLPPAIDRSPALASAPAPAREPLASSPAPPDPSPHWQENVTRSETTKPVARCQIGPFSSSSTVSVEIRSPEQSQIATRVVKDDETATGIEALPSLLGKEYIARRTTNGVWMGDTEGKVIPEIKKSCEIARGHPPRLDRLGGGRTLARGRTEVHSLEGPVAIVADVALHGMPAQQTRVTVTFVAAHRGEAGDDLAFHVALVATEADAGMCHRWQSVAELTGDLRLRASDGAFSSLHLQGTLSDSEGLCQDPSGKPGPPPPPHTCNRGVVSVDVRLLGSS